MATRVMGKTILALAFAAACAGCNSFSLPFTGEASQGAQSTQHPVTNNLSDNLPESEKLKVKPLSPEELDCPSIDVAEGGSSVRVGGPENAAVRYQFTIGDVARECDPQGDQFALKVGVQGLLLIGPAGKPGAYSTDLKIVVSDPATKKPIYQKTYKVALDTKGGSQAPFRLVVDPILLPLTRTDLDNLFDVTVGFGKTADTPVDKHKKKKKQVD